MAPQWNIRRYREKDEHGIIQLIKIVYDGAKWTVPFWTWKHKCNPVGHFIGVTDYKGQIVGHMALIPTYMKIADKIALGCQAVDLVVHPSFRRQGMFVAIGRYITNEAGKNGLSICYGIPNAPAYFGHLKYGWFDVGRIPALTKFSSSRSLLHTNKVKDLLKRYPPFKSIVYNKRFQRVLLRLLRVLLLTVSLYCKLRFRIRNDSELTVSEIRSVTSFNTRANDFWEKASRHYNIVVVKGKRYLNWRYFGRPGNRYKVFVAERNNEMLGFIVFLSEDRNGTKQGYIVDLLTLEDCGGIADSLVSKAIEYLKERNVDSIHCWMLGNNVYYKVLRKNAFFPLTSKILIARINSSKMRIHEALIKDYRNWYFTMGDSDLI